MSDIVERIAAAVLYEGYILYPYRPSVKNRQRWTFGGLFPEACNPAQTGDASSNQTECLVEGGPGTNVDVMVRFLHLTQRTAGEIVPALASWSEEEEVPFRPVETLRVGNRLLHSWQEAEERTVSLDGLTLGALVDRPVSRTFAFPGGRRREPVRGETGEIAGVLVREQQAVAGLIEVQAMAVGADLIRLTVRITNRTPLPEACLSRDETQRRALLSTHTILRVHKGAFVSLLDPPTSWAEAAAACRNVGTWPVLVGEEGQRQTMLSSPIVLYDYLQIAPESAGDFFDGTEIDEMLTLRVLTLTDEEKQAMTAVDERAGALLARTEALAREQLARLHGTVRSLRPVE
jgi:hypothetical protein